MTLEEQIMKLQTYKMFEVEDTVYVERDNVLKLLEREPCEDAISRQVVIDAMFGLCDDGENPHIDAITDTIERIAPVTPQPKAGHWSRKTKVDAFDIAGVKTWGIKCQCDKCDFTTIVVEDFGYYKYCPNCGAKMQEGEE